MFLLVVLGLALVGARALWSATRARPPAVVFVRIDINRASLGELTVLPGIGRITACELIRGRPYATLDEVRAVLGDDRYERIRKQVSLKSPRGDD